MELIHLAFEFTRCVTKCPGSVTADTALWCLTVQGNFESVAISVEIQGDIRCSRDNGKKKKKICSLLKMCLAVKTFLAERTLDLYGGFLGINDKCMLFIFFKDCLYR